MIQINLLPDDLRPVKRTLLPHLLSILVLIVTVGMIVVYHQGSVMMEERSLRAQRDDNVRRLEQLQPIVDEANELTLKEQQLAARVETINEIVQDRIIWSRQLWNLSRLAPDNIWYSGFETESRRVQQTVHEVREDGTRTERQTTVQIPIFRVSGYVVDSPEGSRPIGPFLTALATDPEFSEVFDLESPDFRDTDFDGYPVRRFAIDFTYGRELEQ